MFKRLFLAVFAYLILTSCDPNIRKSRHDDRTEGRFLTPMVNRNEAVYLRTRIAVDEAVDGKPSRTIAQVIEELQYTEELFVDLNIHFVIVSMKVCSPSENWFDYMNVDAEMYPNCLNIYYCANRSAEDEKNNTSGMGTFPWMIHNDAILIYAPDFYKRTLAHEVGHWLGLFHTFDKIEIGDGTYDDCVEDTLSPEEFNVLMPYDDYEYYNNIMNYHGIITNSVTIGQIERMRWYLMNDRRGVHMKNPFEHVDGEETILLKPIYTP